MVGYDGELPSQQVIAELLTCRHHSQELLIGGTIPPLGPIQNFESVGDDFPLCFTFLIDLVLLQYGSQPIITGVGGQKEISSVSG